VVETFFGLKLIKTRYHSIFRQSHQLPQIQLGDKPRRLWILTTLTNKKKGICTGEKAHQNVHLRKVQLLTAPLLLNKINRQYNILLLFVLQYVMSFYCVKAND
jgi:hypothetical protein